MSRIVVLDAGPLGMITNPRSSFENERCKEWLAGLVRGGVEVVIPEIADYELRRELLRASKSQGLARLDALKCVLSYVPITTPVMLKAAQFWASARNLGRKSADDASLDADMILAAQGFCCPRQPRTPSLRPPMSGTWGCLLLPLHGKGFSDFIS